MKNLLKAALFVMVVAVFTSCQGGMRNGKLDSVATTDVDTGASTTVDTLPQTIDTTKTDTTK
jgi:hypothetical protein